MASDDRSPDSPHERPRPETSPRRLREQSQVDFELDLFGRVLDRDPLYTDVLRVQAGNLSARGHFARALQLDRRLVRLLPDRPVPWYNLACSYALLGMTDPAMNALQRAIDLGYCHFRHLRRDPDLKSLRRDPRFERLIRRASSLEF